MKKIALILTLSLIALILISGCLWQTCTMEAKICSDGSTVGRTGPNCEFAPCPKTMKCSDDLNCLQICSDTNCENKISYECIEEKCVCGCKEKKEPEEKTAKILVEVPATAKKGDTIDANIWIFDVNDLMEFKLVLGADSNKANIAAMQEGRFLKLDGTDTLQISKKIGNTWMLSVSRTTKNGLTGKGLLATAVIQAVFPGIVEIQIKKSDLINSSGEYLSHYARSGVIIIE